MKRYLLALMVMMAMSLGAVAQKQMFVNKKDGSVVRLNVDEIESVTWGDGSSYAIVKWSDIIFHHYLFESIDDDDEDCVGEIRCITKWPKVGELCVRLLL